MKKIYRVFSSVLLIALCFAVNLAIAQERTVTGTVTDASNGQSLPGVNIVVVGTSTGSTTDLDGKYSLSVSDGASLTFSFVGYVSQTIAVGNQSVIDVQLATNVETLSEIVVIGYGAVKKSDLTGSVSSVKEKDFNKGVFTSPDQLLQGKASGVQVFNNDGTPGGASTVRIRGNSSVRTGNQPLYVVDGIPLDGRSAKPGVNANGVGDTPASNPLNFINPSDIASMEILKDASATAIYGSRGANGVILITTKSGSAGAPKVDFSVTSGVSSIQNKIDILNAAEYRDALSSYGLTSGDFGGSSDAMGYITRTGITQNYNMSIGGGSEKGNYRVSAGYLSQEGIIKHSGLKKYTATTNGNYNFFGSDILSIGYNVIASHTDESMAPVTNNSGFTGDLIAQALQWNPTRTLFNPDGSFNFDKGSTTINPAAMLDAYHDRAQTTTVLASVSPSIKITDNLVYKLQVSLNHSVGERQTQISRWINVQGVEDRGWANRGNNVLNTQQYTQTLTYNTDLTTGVTLNAVVGYEFQKFDNRGFGVSGLDFLVDDVPYTDILQNTSQQSRNLGGFHDPTVKLQSFFGRANVNINDKYLLTATVRSDGSSKFGKNNQYGTFPSFAAKWNLSNEDFMGGGGIFNTLSLRAGWGQTGNQEFPAGAAQERYGLGNNQTFAGLLNVANPDLKWETSTTTNVGIDFAVMDAKLTGSVDYFYKSTKDLLFNFETIQPAPAGRYWTNLDGNVINKGVEVALDASVIDQDNLSLNVGANVSFLSNKLINYNGPAVLTGNLNGQGISNTTIQRLENNKPLNAFYLRQWNGLDASGFDNLTDNGNTLFFIGDPNPDVLLGFSTNLTAGKLDFVMNFAGAFGHQIYNNTANTVLPIGNLGSRNISKDLVTAAVQEDQSNSIKASTRYLENGDYVKMTNFSIGYNIGNIQGIKNIRVSLTGQNLFTITGYSGFDPEVNTDKSRNGVPSFGIEYTSYPTPRTFLLGVNFSF